MNSRLLAAFLCLAAVLPGCVIHGDDDCCDTNPQTYPGDVTFRWTLDSLRCSEEVNVHRVQIRIPGESLENNGLYPCSANGYDGIVLHDFVPGTYSFTVEAMSYSRETMYVASGTFTVNGDVTVDIDLTPVGSPPSYAFVNWLFPANTASANPTCNQAGVAYVDARVNGGEWARFDCEDGHSGESIRTPYLEPGQHFLELVALDSSLRTRYSYSGNLTTRSGVPTSHTASLSAVTSGASIRWNIINGNAALSCAQAGVTHVDARIDDGGWVRFACTQGNGGGVVDSPALEPGEHYLELVAVDSQDRPLYYFGREFTTTVGNNATLTADMWIIGGASIRWDIKSGSRSLTCSEAGLTLVAINFRDYYTNELVYGIMGDYHGCNDAPVVYEFLKPGRYRVEMYGRASDGREYRTGSDSPLIDVVAHTFPGPNAALPVTVYQQ